MSFYTPFGLVDQKFSCDCSRFTNKKPGDEAMEEFLATIKSKSSNAQQSCGSYKRLVYGKEKRQFMDVFYPKTYSTDADIFVYFHGGYWKTGSADMYWFIAVPIVEAGNICIIMSRVLFPQVSIMEILEQDRKALEVIAQQFKETKSITIFGHSSGGHESAMMASTSWKDVYDDVDRYFQSKLKRVVVSCGVVDVTQVLASSLNLELKLRWNEAISLSPLAHIQQLKENIKRYGFEYVLLLVENECPSLQKAAVIYEQELKLENVSFKTVTFSNEDHFTVIQSFDEKTSMAVKTVLGTVDSSVYSK